MCNLFLNKAQLEIGLTVLSHLNTAFCRLKYIFSESPGSKLSTNI